MRVLLWCLSILATAALSLAGLALLLPGMKEGHSFEELPFHFGGAAILTTAGVAWWYGAGRSARRAVVGWIILAPPFLAALFVAGDLALARYQGIRLADSVRIAGYREIAIEWPGFDGPVGLRVEIELEHGSAPGGTLSPPELRMGPSIEVPLDRAWAVQTSGSGYFKGDSEALRGPPLTLLKSVLFRAQPQNPDWSQRLGPEDHSRVAFELYPGIIYRLDGPSRLCLSDLAPGLPTCATGQEPQSGCRRRGSRIELEPVYHDGADLSALWYFFGGSDLIADLGAKLTATLRQQSRLQGAPEAWTAMQRRLEPAGLARAGYVLCPSGPDSHTGFSVCYCR